MLTQVGNPIKKKIKMYDECEIGLVYQCCLSFKGGLLSLVSAVSAVSAKGLIFYFLEFAALLNF